MGCAETAGQTLATSAYSLVNSETGSRYGTMEMCYQVVPSTGAHSQEWTWSGDNYMQASAATFCCKAVTLLLLGCE